MRNMRAFEVSVNGKKLCLAGICNDGVLTSIVNWVARSGEGDLFLTVSGLISQTEEHVDWARHYLSVGDEVHIKITETDSADKPIEKYRVNRATGTRQPTS
jgi:hypothetical protein